MLNGLDLKPISFDSGAQLGWDFMLNGNGKICINVRTTINENNAGVWRGGPQRD
jgi:hypothetical protein